MYVSIYILGFKSQLTSAEMYVTIIQVLSHQITSYTHAHVSLHADTMDAYYILIYITWCSRIF